MFLNQFLLSLLIWLPILGAIALLVTEKGSNPYKLKMMALSLSIVCFVLSVMLYLQYDPTVPSMQFREIWDWIPFLGIQYDLGVDGISVLLIVLTSFTTIVIICATWNSIHHSLAQYYASFLIMQGLMIGVFASLNAIVFYIFWEATLVPMYLIIGIWGSSKRTYASIKFFLYTFFGSAIMLAAFIYLGLQANHFSILKFYNLSLDLNTQLFIFIAFLLGFAIKVPMWPVHTWLPHAHTEAPTGGSVVLAAIMLKMGAYGFIRFSLPIVPDASAVLSPWMIALSLIAVVYIALVALVQKDMKRLIAYSSISHMGFVTLGCFMIYQVYAHTGAMKDAALGLEGALVVMISHGFVSGALFITIGYLYDRLHTRNIKDFGGVVNSMPVFSAFVMIFALANAGMPGTSGFVGEFMVILASMKAGFWIAFFAATTLIFGAAYTLWMYKRVFFGPATRDAVVALNDIQGMEIVAFVLLAAAILFLGFYPAPLVDVMHKSVEQILLFSQTHKL